MIMFVSALQISLTCLFGVIFMMVVVEVYPDPLAHASRRLPESLEEANLKLKSSIPLWTATRSGNYE